MSTGNILDSSFHSIQFFNPEFDQTTGKFKRSEYNE